MTARNLRNSDDYLIAVSLVSMAIDGRPGDVHALIATVDDPGPLILALIAVAGSAVCIAHKEMDLDDPALTLRNIALRIATEQEN